MTVMRHHLHLLGPNGVPLGGHSLSWTSAEKRNMHGNIMIAKVWTPEDPRRHKKGLGEAGHDILAECCSTINDVSN